MDSLLRSDYEAPEDWKELSPLAWMTDKVAEPEEHECNFLKYMRTHRNVLCTAIINGALALHVIEQAVQPPASKPHLWLVANNVYCMAFFMLMTYFVHCKMVQELKRHQESESLGLSKKLDSPTKRSSKVHDQEKKPARKSESRKKR